MQLIKDQTFGGERPLFAAHDVHLDHVTILAGESAIKECSHIVATDCRFEGNYPFWHVHGFTIENCYFDVGGRSALWYSDHLKMKDTLIDAPKMFREMSDLDLENVTMNDADEVFWRCRDIRVRNLKLHGGTYPFMLSRDIYVDGLESDSKYVFQYVKNAEIHHARITTKDAFWEVEDVTIYDSELDGEYLGWHSRNLRLVNCHIAPRFRVFHAASRHTRRDNEHQEPHVGPHRGGPHRLRHARRKHQGARRLPRRGASEVTRSHPSACHSLSPKPPCPSGWLRRQFFPHPHPALNGNGDRKNKYYDSFSWDYDRNFWDYTCFFWDYDRKNDGCHTPTLRTSPQTKPPTDFGGNRFLRTFVAESGSGFTAGQEGTP